MNTPPSTQNKLVRFSENARIRPYLHLNNMTDEEIGHAWYSKEEFRAIRKDAKSIVHIMIDALERNVTIDPDLCTRGLECALQTANNVCDLKNAVMRVQQHQKATMKKLDPIELRRASLNHSIGSLSTALRQAAHDAIEADSILTKRKLNMLPSCSSPNSKVLRSRFHRIFRPTSVSRIRGEEVLQ